MWKFIWWISIVCPVVWVLWWAVKKVLLGITWPFRWGWRKAFKKKNKYLKELEALGGKGDFHTWLSITRESVGLSQWSDAPDVLHSASSMDIKVYEKMCEQVRRIFPSAEDDWGMDIVNHYSWK